MATAKKPSMKPAPKKGGKAAPAKKIGKDSAAKNARAQAFAGKASKGKIGPGSGTNSGAGGAG